MDRCQFTYIRKKDEVKQTAVGVEQAWDVLCAKLDREGPGIADGTHYFTTSAEGPELFAVDASGANVYYHDKGEWHRYITACDIKFDTISDNGMGCPPRASARVETINGSRKNQNHLYTTAYINLFEHMPLLDTCEFLYIGRADSMPKHVRGIERSWEELKQEMGRSGPEYPGAIYFKTISFQGPQLFAVVNNKTVFYHDGGVWHRYITACNIKFDTMESDNPNPYRATMEDAVIQQSAKESEWIFISENN